MREVPGPENAPVSVLYIEDNPANLMLIRRYLQRFPNFELREADNAEAGLALIREHKPDVVLMDINLPGMSGFDALEIMKQEGLRKHITIIAISANALSSEVERGIKEGFDEYLTKPVDFIRLMELLEDVSVNRLV
jgi:CheY-like chemotaxis protein